MHTPRRPWTPGLGIAAVFHGGLAFAAIEHFSDLAEWATLGPFLVAMFAAGLLLARRYPMRSVVVFGVLVLLGMVTMAYTMADAASVTLAEGGREAPAPGFVASEVAIIAFYVAPWLFVPLVAGGFVSRRFLPRKGPSAAAA